MQLTYRTVLYCKQYIVLEWKMFFSVWVPCMLPQDNFEVYPFFLRLFLVAFQNKYHNTMVRMVRLIWYFTGLQQTPTWHSTPSHQLWACVQSLNFEPFLMKWISGASIAVPDVVATMSLPLVVAVSRKPKGIIIGVKKQVRSTTYQKFLAMDLILWFWQFK